MPAGDTRITAGTLSFSDSDDALVVIYSRAGAHLGRRYVLDRELVTIGRDHSNDISLDSDAVSRFHARLERDGGVTTLSDLGSTNGTFVNDRPDAIDRHQLRKGDLIKVGNTIFKYLAGSDVENQYHQAIFALTITDGLTGAGNATYLRQVLDREVPRARRHGRPLAVLMIDLDHFKHVNDTYGHLAGDAVLRDTVRIARTRLRPDDVLARCGGEEFCAVLPETTLPGAVRIATALHDQIAGHCCRVDDHVIRVTASIGAARFTEDMTVDGLLKAADDRLYDAKTRGRNRVCWEE